MTIDHDFSEGDLSRIRDAVRDAESRTSGEIVPYVVERSDDYDTAYWRAGSLIMAFSLATHGLVRILTERWFGSGLTEAFLVTLGAGFAMILLVRFLPFLRRFFAGSESLDRRVAQRAAEAFLAEEVFRTKQRTGILIFVSMLERRVYVLADSGINAKVGPSAWQSVKESVVSGMKEGKPADGLAAAIRMSGEILERSGFVRKADDTNELPDTLHLRGD